MDATATKDKNLKTEEIQLDEASFKTIVEEVSKALTPEIEKAVKEGSAVTETIEEAIEKALDKDGKVADAIKAGIDTEIGRIEEVNKKIDKDQIDAKDYIGKGLADGTIDKEIAEMTPAMRFAKGMVAITSDEKDPELVKRLNAYALASQKTERAKLTKQEQIAKTGYANEGNQSDGSVLVPDAEFVTTLFDNLPKYGVAFRDADVRQTDRTSVRVISLDSGLTFFKTAEAGVKTSAKLTFSKGEVTLSKYAVIVPATDELTDDAAIDYWNVVTRELTRAYARLADEITFTDPTSGLTNLSGVITQPVSGAGTTIKWDDLLNAQGKQEDDLDTSNAKWYMRKETWFRLVMTKGTTNDAYLAGSLNAGFNPNVNQPTTPWGTPVVFTRVLPSSGVTPGSPGVVGSNDAYAVYGDLRNYILYNKRGMQLTMSSEATIVDTDGATTNLFTQDITAMRAVVRLLGIFPKGNRSKFVIVGTGTVS